MIIAYSSENGEVIATVRGFPKAREENRQLFIEGRSRPVISDLRGVSWGYFNDVPVTTYYIDENKHNPLCLADIDTEPTETPVFVEEELAQLKQRVDDMEKTRIEQKA